MATQPSQLGKTFSDNLEERFQGFPCNPLIKPFKPNHMQNY